MELITMDHAESYGNAVTLDVKELKRAIATLKRVVAGKTNIPVLGGVLIESGNGNCTISGTDLEIGAIARLKGRGNVRMVAHLRELEASLKTVKGGNVRLFPVRNAEQSQVGVAGDSGASMIEGFDVEGFPELPKVAGDVHLRVTAQTWRPILSEVLPCISVEESRFTLNGAKLVAMSNGIVRLVATDGHRLAYRDWDADCKPFDALIPRSALVFTSKMDGVLEFRQNADFVSIDNGETLLVARKLTGNFPEYWRVIPKLDTYKRASVNRAMFLAGMESAVAFRRVMDRKQRPAVEVKLNGKAIITAKYGDKAYGSSAPCSWNGPTDTLVTLDGSYMADALKAMQGDNFTLYVEPKALEDRVITERAIVLEASGVIRGKTIIMPMRS